MSQTRILCNDCGFVQVYCKCKDFVSKDALRKLATDFCWIPDEYETETTAYKLWFELQKLLNGVRDDN